jgi:hypothetical protein
MTLPEMKFAAIKKICDLGKKKDVEEILVHLAKISLDMNKKFDAEVFFQNMSGRYDSILKKLAE